MNLEFIEFKEFLETESQGRVHTSAITVAVLTRSEEVDFELNLADVKKDTLELQVLVVNMSIKQNQQ